MLDQNLRQSERVILSTSGSIHGQSNLYLTEYFTDRPRGEEEKKERKKEKKRPAADRARPDQT